MDDITKARQLSPLTLAFLGDAVFELHVRERLAEKGSAPVGALHRRAVNVVCAKAQSVAAELLLPLLTEEELARLNDYHRLVYDTVSPLLPAEEQAWLAQATAPLQR